MLQRVMIAIALINNPRLLIADEPTTALDVTIQAQILDLMNELRESYDAWVIMITHDLGVIAETCEQVAVFYAGQVVEQASVDAIFHHTAHPYTSGLLRSVTSLGGEQKELYTIRGTVPTAGQFSSGCRFADRCEHCMTRCREAVPPLTRRPPGTSAAAGSTPAAQRRRRHDESGKHPAGRSASENLLSHPGRRNAQGRGPCPRRGGRLLPDPGTGDLRPGGGVGLRQVHHRPEHPPPHRTHRRNHSL